MVEGRAGELGHVAGLGGVDAGPTVEVLGAVGVCQTFRGLIWEEGPNIYFFYTLQGSGPNTTAAAAMGTHY